jgi:murein DD-endopeptidase MepM/ murein hydrolase activator NlpD
MNLFKRVYRGLFTPITIMLVPHSCKETVRCKIPAALILSVIIFSFIGAGYVYSVVDDALRYEPTKKELEYYKGQFAELESTIVALDMAKKDFNNLFALESKEEVLENMEDSDVGSIDMEFLRKKINKTIDSVAEIRDYLSEARDLYMATPMGWPVKGWMSSKYGYRMHPTKKVRDFHTGLDVSARPGTPIRTSADGIISFSGRSGANGNLVAIEHGFGYTTYYAHNKKNLVKEGDIVKRGDIIALVGSTGRSTGPHLHYEVWKSGKDINPMPYVKGGKL